MKWNWLYLMMSLLFFIVCSNKKVLDVEQDPIVQKYADVTIVDIHNHDASHSKYKKSMSVWKKYGIDKIVLFGDISEPSAQVSDAIAFKAYTKNKEMFIPFIAGINIPDSSCLSYIRENFEKGVCGIGEIVAASSNSPVASILPWKGQHPMDGYFPEIYALCAEYNKPILLHIDPPVGLPIQKLKEAAVAYPNTKIIFAHANAYNSPGNIQQLLDSHDNIYIDFFAGFTAYNPDSEYELADFVPLINQYPDKFMISSDSAYGIDYDKAYSAVYELFELLEMDVVEKIAGENFLDLLRG